MAKKMASLRSEKKEWFSGERVEVEGERTT